MATVKREYFDPHNGVDYAKEIEIADIWVNATCPYCESPTYVSLGIKTLHRTVRCENKDCGSIFNAEISAITVGGGE